jgi:hypothetical protein
MWEGATMSERTSWRTVMVLLSLPFLALAAWRWLSGYAVGSAPAVDCSLYTDAAAGWTGGPA